MSIYFQSRGIFPFFSDISRTVLLNPRRITSHYFSSVVDNSIRVVTYRSPLNFWLYFSAMLVSCLVCGKPTTTTHMGMDVCRACTVFYQWVDCFLIPQFDSGPNLQFRKLSFEFILLPHLVVHVRHPVELPKSSKYTFHIWITSKFIDARRTVTEYSVLSKPFHRRHRGARDRLQCFSECGDRPCIDRQSEHGGGSRELLPDTDFAHAHLRIRVCF